MMRINIPTLSGILIAAYALASTSALAQEACANDYQKAVADISAKSDPAIKETADKIKELQKLNLDPNRYIVNFEGKDVPITVKLYALASRKLEAKQNEQKSAEKCAKDVMPLRQASDLAAIYYTYGLSLLLPPETTRVDWAEIIKNGKPLGGDQALIPKARDDLLDAVGLDNRSTPGHFLRDPKCIFSKC